MMNEAATKLIFGIAFAAIAIGCLVIGIAAWESFSGSVSFFDHKLFAPGATCTGAGLLSVYILFLATPRTS